MPVDLRLPFGTRLDVAVVPLSDHPVPFQNGKVILEFQTQILVPMGVGIEQADRLGWLSPYFPYDPSLNTLPWTNLAP